MAVGFAFAQVFLLVFGVGAVIAIIVVLQVLQSRRRKALRELAASQGWAYTERDRDLPQQFRQFNLFRQGGSRVAHDILTLPDQPPCRLFTHNYTVSNGKSSTTYSFACVLLPMPFAADVLGIQREGLALKLFDALGGEDIDFESDEFSRAYWVTCADRRFAYDAITPAMMEFLLGPGLGWTWVWDGPWLLMSRQGRLDAQTAVGMRDAAFRFRALVPARLGARQA